MKEIFKASFMKCDFLFQVKVSMSHTSLARLVTWSAWKGARWWGRVAVDEGLRGRGLFSTQSIPLYDFVLVVPLSATFSFLNFQGDDSFLLRVTSEDFGQQLSWWPDLDWGTFSLVVWLTRAWLTNDPVASAYLGSLPRDDRSFPVLRSIARQAMTSPEYRSSTERIAAQLRMPAEVFDSNIEWMYTMVRSRSVPLWSRGGTGHPAFAETVYAREAKEGGDVACLVPFLDLVNHSQEPNSVIGIPEPSMVEYLRKERDVQASDLYVIQALRDISPGEEIVVDYNVNYGFDSDMFAAWFDTPLRAASVSKNMPLADLPRWRNTGTGLRRDSPKVVIDPEPTGLEDAGID